MHVLRVYGAALLVPGLPIGILVWNVAAFWAADGSAGLPARLTGGGMGAALAAVVGTWSLLSERRAGPGGGSGPRRSSTIAVHGGPDLPYRVNVTLLDLPAGIRHADANAGQFAAETGGSGARSGEYVTVELQGDRAHPEARISSRPRSRLLFFDHGPGRRIVDRVIEALQD